MFLELSDRLFHEDYSHLVSLYFYWLFLFNRFITFHPLFPRVVWLEWLYYFCMAALHTCYVRIWSIVLLSRLFVLYSFAIWKVFIVTKCVQSALTVELIFILSENHTDTVKKLGRKILKELHFYLKYISFIFDPVSVFVLVCVATFNAHTPLNARVWHLNTNTTCLSAGFLHSPAALHQKIQKTHNFGNFSTFAELLDCVGVLHVVHGDGVDHDHSVIFPAEREGGEKKMRR